ncbi:nicotinamide n-methyltransferase [Ascosphaera pollenicola]|nr:nicotinamide n-methyltransferase [Ascosphaera pollenicola]
MASSQQPSAIAAPRVVGPKKLAVTDITQMFTEACSALNTAQLVKSPHFTLFESVGALEIMDPKMDSGYLAPGETLDDDYDVSRNLRPEEVVGIMDQLLCHEAAWHMGHSIAQTIFTSIYVDRILWPVPQSFESARFDRPVKGRHTGYPSVSNPDTSDVKPPTPASNLVSLVLRAYCLSLVKACDRAHSRITLEYFYEEEDFVSQLFNRKLLSDIHTAEIVALVDEALSWLERQTPTTNDSASTQSLTQTQIDAITSRLLFRRNFLIALDEDLNVLRSRDTSCFEESRERLNEILLSVSDEKKREAISKPVPESFSTKFQRGLASTVPPKPIVDTISMETAVHFLRQLCTDAIDVVELLPMFSCLENDLDINKAWLNWGVNRLYTFDVWLKDFSFMRRRIALEQNNVIFPDHSKSIMDLTEHLPQEDPLIFKSLTEFLSNNLSAIV